MKKLKGFTLIELLIVITIIGILAVALVPRISQGPARARDVQRKADMQNIASALELYYADHGYYPAANSDMCMSGTTSDAIKGYLGNNTPTPPAGSASTQCLGTSNYYAYDSSDGSGYTLAVGVEQMSVTDAYNCFTSLPTSWNPFTDVACTDGYPGNEVYYVIER